MPIRPRVCRLVRSQLEMSRRSSQRVAREGRLSHVLRVGLALKQRGGAADDGACGSSTPALALCQSDGLFGRKRHLSEVGDSESSSEQWWVQLAKVAERADVARIRSAASSVVEGGRGYASSVASMFEEQARTKRAFIYAEDTVYKQASEQAYVSTADREETLLGDYDHDRESSSDEVAVYRSSGEVAVAIRGSTTQTDWTETDWMLVRGRLKQSPRYSENRTLVWGVVDSSALPVVLTGHSLGGSIAIELVQDLLAAGKEARAVVFNAATGRGQVEARHLPVRHYSAKGDVVSALGRGKFGQRPEDDVLVDVTSWDASRARPRAAHSMSDCRVKCS